MTIPGPTVVVPYVSSVTGGTTVKIAGLRDNQAAHLVRNGFADQTPQGGTVQIVDAKSEDRLPELFAFLRDEGVAFAAGQGWSPSELFEQLRDEGRLTGPYSRISWRGPGKPHVDENC